MNKKLKQTLNPIIMKTLFLSIALLIASLTFASGENPTKTVKTLFGTEMEIQNVTLCKYQNVSFYVANNSPIANLYKNDIFKFQVFMALHLDDYKNEFKTFLNS